MLQKYGFSCYLVQCLAAIVPSSSYFQASVGGYVFSIPGFNDWERRTQVSAQTWCNGNQSKLLEIRNGDIQNSIVSFIRTAMNNSQMTGNTVMTNGKRFNTPLTWVNAVVYSSIVSVKGQEPGFINSYGYLSSTQSGFEFFADSLTVTRGYICEGSSFCATGFTTNGRCYKSFSETLSWFDARKRCVDGTGDLASFDFIVDNSGFSALNGSGWNSPSSYWIGIARQKWMWQLSKYDVVYSQWSGGHPMDPGYSTNQTVFNECLCLLPNTPVYDWKWTECDCSQAYQFVCMIEETGSSISTRPHISPATVSVISSTTRNLVGKKTQPSGEPSSFANLESVSDAGSQSPTASSSTCSSSGVGVGLGVGIPMALIILILALIIVQQRRKIKSFEMNRNIASVGTQMEAKAGNAATYESLKKDGQRGDTSTYEELQTRENSQNSEA